MDWLRYATWALALFFAGSWAFGLVASPRNRIGSNILTVLIWWAEIAAAAFGAIDVLHLLWAFPLALLLPALLAPLFWQR